MRKKLKPRPVSEIIDGLVAEHKRRVEAKDPDVGTLWLTYQLPWDRPKPQQLQAIGRVATTWSILETVIQGALAKLALASSYPALAFTTDLSIDNRLKAVKTLVALHRERYRLALVQESVLAGLTQLVTRISQLKDERNRVVHLHWMGGIGDKLFGMSLRARTVSALEEAHKKRSPYMSTAEINALSDEIQTTSDQLHILCQFLPDIDESWLAKSVKRGLHRRRRETE